MTYEQQDKITSLHHQMWALMRDVAKTDAVSAAIISEARNTIESLAHKNQDAYHRAIERGGIKLLADVAL